MYGKKDLKAKLLYVGLTEMCVGRFLFFLLQMLNRRMNVVLAYNGFGLGEVYFLPLKKQTRKKNFVQAGVK